MVNGYSYTGLEEYVVPTKVKRLAANEFRVYGSYTFDFPYVPGADYKCNALFGKVYINYLDNYWEPEEYSHNTYAYLTPNPESYHSRESVSKAVTFTEYIERGMIISYKEKLSLSYEFTVRLSEGKLEILDEVYYAA